MKKIFLILILVFLSLIFVGCEVVDGSDSSTTSSVTSSNKYTDDSSEDEFYKDITCVDHKEFKEIDVHISGLNDFITLRIPKLWDIVGSGSEYNIVYDGRNIGKISKGISDDLYNWKTVKAAETNLESVKIYTYIDKFGAKESLRFRHRVYFEFESESGFTLEVNYKEITSVNIASMQYRAAVRPVTSDPKMGCLNISDPKNILIIGNSFINSSSIYSILTEMMSDNWKDCNVDAYSRGYATVKTYAEDEYVMSSIRNREYDAVFVCGFYSDDEIDQFRKILNACKSSGTKAVVFPAHNEGATSAKTAANIDTEVAFLNWKGEIDSFIKNGMSKWDFCVQDSHSHSNELAGYIGAHMIYRALYGQCPEGKISSSITQNHVDKKLGDYVETGIIQNLNLDNAIVLN